MQEIRTGIIGVGNCASSFVQGRFYYGDPDADIPGLITKNFGGYRTCDIHFVAAFDVDERKVGRDLSEAIFAPPNCTTVFQKDIPFMDCPVEMGGSFHAQGEYLLAQDQGKGCHRSKPSEKTG